MLPGPRCKEKIIIRVLIFPLCILRSCLVTPVIVGLGLNPDSGQILHPALLVNQEKNIGEKILFRSSCKIFIAISCMWLYSLSFFFRSMCGMHCGLSIQQDKKLLELVWVHWCLQ